MMLTALNDFARERGLVDDPLYESKSVDFLVCLDRKGKFLSLQSRQDERGRGTPMAIPRLPARSVNVAAGFLADNTKYVLGHDPETASRQGKANKGIARLAAFLGLVREALAEVDSAELRAVEAFLTNDAERAKAVAERKAEEWTGSEMLAFTVGDSVDPVHEQSSIRAWWERRSQQMASLGKKGLCLVSGKVGVLAETHPKLKNVPSAQGAGAALVSFNANAFESHGLEQGDNAPISQQAALGYVLALNDLLRKSETRRFRQGIQLGEDSVLVFWTNSTAEQESLLLSVVDPTEADVRQLVEAPFRGVEPSELDTRRFYAVTLAGNSGRVAVRDWFQTSLGEVKQNLRRYFADLRLGEGSTDKPTPIWRLLKAVEAPSGRGLTPDIATRMLGAALRGQPFPRQLLSAALERLRLPPADDKLEREQLRLRVALVKAYLIRHRRSGTPSLEVSVSLDKNNSSQPYVLGRLFAVLERLQGAALGDINATIRDRYFGAASRNPVTVFPRLLQLSVHHASKADSGGWLERQKGEVMALLPPKAPFPNVLTLEDQGLFAVGYYHQREAFFIKRPPSEGKTAKNESAND
ncbi:type I-C CRISPR-associated protein Cas8c/Csd1 [Myxococcus sp. K15C18031901]|uniref:type I-C CRISPR-associated protein Cas8c/Csd1 n=1 Tax=Myxococcus dinghuensis TaxID=2906761 RepID=UPI0020A776D9|nr:type I-C CRISPR-associated protein Cas8c/Csd1 [Myxococcus dinghuensis]MCP3105466.1 type I-C CRISPR-associated protein Cas8c/Csd1 [Myxococcus dinghuensis]